MVMNPDQQASKPRGGLLGLFDKAMKTDEDTGLSPLQNFAAALDPLILKDLRGGEGIRQQGVQRAATMSKNKTVDMLRQQGRNDLADAVMNRTIGAKEAFSVMQSEAAADKAFQRQKDLAAFTANLKAPAAPKLGQDLQKYKLAQAQGFDGTYLEFEQALQGFEPGPGLKALDETFAKTLDGTSATQLSAARQDAASVASVLEKLETGENLTGPLIGSIPEELRALIYPESTQAQQLVEQVVQKNLRAILGGQFAQKEGEQLVKRAYNPKLKPEQNAARLRSLLLTLDAAAQSKQAQTDYFLNNNYSLRGYTGFAGVPTIEDFANALDGSAGAGGSEGPKPKRFVYDSKGDEVTE